MQLLDDPAAVLLAPLPDPLDEGLAAELVAVDALAAQLLLDHRLGGDPGVVGAEDPLHPPAAIRCLRTSASWIVPLSACPMCSDPVTFGGGIATEKFSSAVPSASGVK